MDMCLAEHATVNQNVCCCYHLQHDATCVTSTHFILCYRQNEFHPFFMNTINRQMQTLNLSNHSIEKDLSSDPITSNEINQALLLEFLIHFSVNKFQDAFTWCLFDVYLVIMARVSFDTANKQTNKQSV